MKNDRKFLIDTERLRLVEGVRFTAWELTVAEALTRAVQIDDRTIKEDEFYTFQTFCEEWHPSVRDYGWLLEDQALHLGKLATLARVVSSLAQWMVHGPAKSQLDEGTNGRIATLARLPGIVDGETGYELPPGKRLVIELLQYFPYAYHRMSGVDGSYAEQPTVVVRLKVRWRLADPMECLECRGEGFLAPTTGGKPGALYTTGKRVCRACDCTGKVRPQ